MSNRGKHRLVAVALLGGVALAGCQLHPWSRYRHIPYAKWRADDAARIALLREVAAGTAQRAQPRGPGLYHEMVAARFRRRAYVTQVALRLLLRSPANPSPGCAKPLSRLRWRIDRRYSCAVGWTSRIFVGSYLNASGAQRRRLRQRIRAMGYHCGPVSGMERYWLTRLLRAQSCATGAEAAPTPMTPAPNGDAANPGPTPPARVVVPPPAPGEGSPPKR